MHFPVFLMHFMVSVASHTEEGTHHGDSSQPRG
jgi:hypothetical protein